MSSSYRIAITGDMYDYGGRYGAGGVKTRPVTRRRRL